jgi:hypothetical protein
VKSVPEILKVARIQIDKQKRKAKASGHVVIKLDSVKNCQERYYTEEQGPMKELNLSGPVPRIDVSIVAKNRQDPE